jgi:hypothetical protein
MRRQHAPCSRCGFIHHAEAETRRAFLVRCSKLVAGAFAASQVAACSTDFVTEPTAPTIGKQDTSAVAAAQPFFYPEDYQLDLNDVAPAINRALRDAARVAGSVVLGRDHTDYVFRSHIWIGGDTTVALSGISRSITLRNGGGLGFDRRPTRILMRRNGILQNLHIAPVPGTVVPLVPGVDSGADSADGTSDGWMVINCEIDGFSGVGINFGNFSNHVTIRGNYIHHSGDAGIQINTICNLNRVVSNRVEWNARNGIDCNGNDNIIEQNDSHYNGTQEGTTDRNGILVGGILGRPANRNRVLYNRTHFNHRCGMFIGGERMSGTELIGNEASHNVGSGIMVEALTQANTNEALVVTDNRMDRNGYYGYVENGKGLISIVRFARNQGEGNDPRLMLRL